MVIVKVDLTKKIPKKIISDIASRVKQGELIFFPTDTAYALGGRFDKSSVIKKILKTKNRQNDKFALVASDQKQVEQFFSLSADQKIIAKAFWPSPLTIIVGKKFSVRVSALKFLQQLTKEVGAPLIASSANISGQKTPYSPREIQKQFLDNPLTKDLLLLDAGALPKVKTSTIIEVKKNKIKIIRPGSIPARRLKEFVSKNQQFSLID